MVPSASNVFTCYCYSLHPTWCGGHKCFMAVSSSRSWDWIYSLSLYRESRGTSQARENSSFLKQKLCLCLFQIFPKFFKIFLCNSLALSGQTCALRWFLAQILLPGKMWLTFTWMLWKDRWRWRKKPIARDVSLWWPPAWSRWFRENWIRLAK